MAWLLASRSPLWFTVMFLVTWLCLRQVLLLHSQEILAAAGLTVQCSSTVPSPLSLLAAHMRCLHDFSSYCLAPLKDYWFCPLRCATILKNCAWPVLCKLLDHRHPLNCLVRPLFLFEPFFLHCGLGFRFQFRR